MQYTRGEQIRAQSTEQSKAEQSILRYYMNWLLYAMLRAKPLILSMNQHVWRTFSSVLSGRLCPYRSERGRYWLQLRGGPYLSRTHFGVHFGSKGGVKKRPLLGTPVWSSFLPILAPFGQHSGPLGCQMESKMVPKRGPKRSQEKE